MNDSMMKKLRTTLCVLAGTSGLATSVQAVAIATLYDTGVDNSGAVQANGSAEIHWQLAAPGFVVASPFVVDSNIGYPFPSWLPDDASSGWIAPSTDAYDPIGSSGSYNYKISFSLAGLDPTTAVIEGCFAFENTAQVFLNGTALTAGSITYTAGNSFSNWSLLALQPADIALLNGGTNTFSFQVDNESAATGLRVDWKIAEASSVPEPGSVTLGLGALGLMLRRRRRA